uniref:Uncharacterized protein n=1 Tax=Oryza nivara TaxID=4536 RepID=A0A0E0GC85_ORYNI
MAANGEHGGRTVAEGKHGSTRWMETAHDDPKWRHDLDGKTSHNTATATGSEHGNDGGVQGFQICVEEF